MYFGNIGFVGQNSGLIEKQLRNGSWRGSKHWGVLSESVGGGGTQRVTQRGLTQKSKLPTPGLILKKKNNAENPPKSWH